MLSRPAPVDIPIARAVERWLRDGKAQGHSAKTTGERQRTMDRVAWWLEREAHLPLTLASLTPDTIRAFLGYVQSPGPRWGSSHPSAQVAKVRPSTVAMYHRTLRALLNWCIAEDLVTGQPLKNVRTPRQPKDLLPPFTEDQLRQMRVYLLQTDNPERDLLAFLLLLDTGMRASELCALSIRDADRENNCLHITGKGNKRRPVYLGQMARRALWKYLETCRRHADPAEPLLVATRGTGTGNALTRRGLYHVINHAAQAAGVTEAHRGPHALRRTFAVNFLRNGGNVYELAQLMGHEDLAVLRRYVKISETDAEDAHRSASPADKLFRP